MAGGRRRRWPGGGGGGARSACPVLAATARRPGALGLPRAVALRRMTGGRHPATMGRTCPSAGLWPVRTLCVLALCVHVAPSMYVAALRTFARPCCGLGVLVQFCRRTYLASESARTTPLTAPAFSPGVSTPVRPCPARLHLVQLRLVRLRPARPSWVLGVLVQFCRRTYLDGESARTTLPTAPVFSPDVSRLVRPRPARSHPVRLRPARSRPVRPNRHHAIAHVCIVRARAMRVGCVRLGPARWGVVFVQGFAYVHLVVALGVQHTQSA